MRIPEEELLEPHPWEFGTLGLSETLGFWFKTHTHRHTTPQMILMYNTGQESPILERESISQPLKKKN